MKNSEIKYNLSTDYEKLLSLLNEGIGIVAFVGIEIDNVVELNNSIVVYMNKEAEWYSLGFSHVWGADLHRIDFEKLCKKNNVRYVMPNNK